MAEDPVVDPDVLREQVRDKYREVATDPHRAFHFHTGRQKMLQGPEQPHEREEANARHREP